MKTSFSFYFRLLICTAVACALVYGLGEETFSQHPPLALTLSLSFLIGIGGMVKNLSATTK